MADSPSKISELPGFYGRPDPEITKLCDDLRALNDMGKIDSLAIVTTSYGHIVEIRKRLGQTRTTLLGGLTVLVQTMAADARDQFLPVKDPQPPTDAG